MLEKDRYGTTYNDNLRLFRCLGLHLGREAAILAREYTDARDNVKLDDLYK